MIAAMTMDNKNKYLIFNFSKRKIRYTIQEKIAIKKTSTIVPATFTMVSMPSRASAWQRIAANNKVNVNSENLYFIGV